ncbi:unnamed protein product [Arctia plantaginis]|uniref:Uncharacterized protein n=3 Tax=Ditrysia TaxID=37567 RepID=A0A8S0ZW91_ARCPL|nr:unnamed protein product [Arctia plantaginis]
MFKIIIFLSVIALAHSSSVFVGQTFDHTGIIRKVYEKIVESVAIPLLRREEEVYFEYPSGDQKIKGIAIKDLHESGAKASITRGGLGFGFVNIKWLLTIVVGPNVKVFSHKIRIPLFDLSGHTLGKTLISATCVRSLLILVICALFYRKGATEFCVCMEATATTMNLPTLENIFSSDEGGGSSDSSDSSEDEVTEHVTHSTPPPDMAAARAQVPTISVTPHSPGLLEDSLQQLRRLHAAVQRMRTAPLPLLATGTSRLSTSCPSLCKDGVAEPDCSSPTHLDFYPQSRKGSGESRQWGLWERRDEGRRSSWAALEPGPRLHDSHRQRSTLNGHSASLSSMESEGEVPRPVRHSTHSLNDNDLAKDFEKVTAALRAGGASACLGGPGAGASVTDAGRLVPRLPLQKSVSTPSIVAAVQPHLQQPQPNVAAGHSDSESDEPSAATVGATQPTRRNNTHQDHLGLHRLAFLEQAAFDHHAEKRRKRGSLFFRKKKDKSRKAAHAWSAAGSGGDCDWCNRALADKPSLYCDNCTMTVHQNVCKDYIVECNKPKSSKTSVGKSLSASSGKNSKRSSVSSASQNPNSTGHIYDDKDGSDHKHDQSNASDDAGVSEWPEVYLTPDQLGDEAIQLGLGATEPDTWAAGAPKGLAKQLGDRETKRQEHIYELILTEKHHCLTIRLMQKMFACGMVRGAGVSAAQVARMFPRVDELWALHAALLARLRARQRAAPRVHTIADILADTFAPPAHHKLKAAYGTYCAHRRRHPRRHLRAARAPQARGRLRYVLCTPSPTSSPTPSRRPRTTSSRPPTVRTVHTVADILADTFAPPAHHKLKAAYGTYCAHRRRHPRRHLRAARAPQAQGRLRYVLCTPSPTSSPTPSRRPRTTSSRPPTVRTVHTVADILADTFAPPAHHKLKAAYGTYCAHRRRHPRRHLRAARAPQAQGRLRYVLCTPSPTSSPTPSRRPRTTSSRPPTVRTVHTVADILADTFASPAHHKLKAAYGEFCSRHRDAVEVFKECCAREARLSRFIRKCQQNPLLRKKGVPECVLFVAQRLTKYPLLLEPLLKTAGDDVSERELLQKALCGVKEILVDVDNQVAAKEREDRKLEIYHRIDAKSFANFRGRKFKKSDILQGNRSLKFEGVATLMQGRSKMQTLLVIVLTDVLFFLHDNNNKYTFFTPDNKTGVVSLVKLLVREKAGAEGRGLYLICSGPTEPEMFELRVHRPKDIHTWIQAIRAAVQNCPEEVEESEAGTTAQSAEERQRQLDARHENIRLITEALRVKDREHATLLEEKMALQMKMVGITDETWITVPNAGSGTAFPGLVFPDYVRLAAPSPDKYALWQEVCKVVKEALEASSAPWSAGGALGRSTSSAGERHSAAYESPALPRRADTFAGFDASRHRGVTLRLSTDTPTEGTENDSAETKPVVEGERHEITGDTALKLQHAIYTLTCIVWQQMTTIHSLEAQVSAWRMAGGCARTPDWSDAQLEELRHAQARLTRDRAAFDAQRAADHAQLAHERQQLQAARQELAEQQKDVEQQREKLFRRLERLQQHGGSQEEIASVGTLSPDSSVSDTTRRKEPKWRNNRGSTGSESSVSACSVRSGVLPPPQLLSAQNETRATVHASNISQMVKQQLPLKLASGKSQQPPPGYHRLHESPSEHQTHGLVIHHTRTGSSPAPLPPQQQTNNKATRTNTYPKLPDKFRVRSPETGVVGVAGVTPAPSTPAPPPEEEVIFF